MLLSYPDATRDSIKGCLQEVHNLPFHNFYLINLFPHKYRALFFCFHFIEWISIRSYESFPKRRIFETNYDVSNLFQNIFGTERINLGQIFFFIKIHLLDLLEFPNICNHNIIISNLF